MRTTLDVDEDVLAAVKAMASSSHTTAGKVLSELARRALNSPSTTRPVSRNGFTLMPPRQSNVVVTMELVNRLRDESE